MRRPDAASTCRHRSLRLSMMPSRVDREGRISLPHHGEVQRGGAWVGLRGRASCKAEVRPSRLALASGERKMRSPLAKGSHLRMREVEHGISGSQAMRLQNCEAPTALILRCEPRRCASVVRRRASKDALARCRSPNLSIRKARRPLLHVRLHRLYLVRLTYKGGLQRFFQPQPLLQADNPGTVEHFLAGPDGRG